MTSAPTFKRNLALVALFSLVVALLPSGPHVSVANASTSSTVAYNFNAGASDLTDNFTRVGTDADDVTHQSSVGLSSSGAISISGSTDAVLRSKTAYTMAQAPVGATYVFESYVKSVGGNGYSGLGFSATDSNSSPPSPAVYRPTDAIGVSVHGSGFVFHNGTTNYIGWWNAQMLRDGGEDLSNDNLITQVSASACKALISSNNSTPDSICASNDGWYRVALSLEVLADDKFAM